MRSRRLSRARCLATSETKGATLQLQDGELIPSGDQLVLRCFDGCDGPALSTGRRNHFCAQHAEGCGSHLRGSHAVSSLPVLAAPQIRCIWPKAISMYSLCYSRCSCCVTSIRDLPHAAMGHRAPRRRRAPITRLLKAAVPAVAARCCSWQPVTTMHHARTRRGATPCHLAASALTQAAPLGTKPSACASRYLKTTALLHPDSVAGR